MNTSEQAIEQNVTVQNPKNRTETGQTNRTDKTSRLPKTHQDFWQSKLKKRCFTSRDGEKIEIPTWQVRMTHLGKEAWFNLETANKTVAAVKAKDIYVSLISVGWKPTLAKYKPDMEVSKDGCTVGQFLDQVKAVSGLKPGTYEIYAKKFRSLVAGVFKISGGKEKHDYVNGGYKIWLDKVSVIRLDKLAADKINDWRVRQLQAASGNPLQHKQTSVTIRSILLSSKALFSLKIRKHLTLHLPSPLPFDGVSLPEAGKSRYKSEIDPKVILVAATRELCEGVITDSTVINPRPELYKILLLALFVGLRRDEIDKLQWRHIQWDRNTIRVETTEHGGTKSAGSEADVDVDPSLLEILKAHIPKPGEGSPFVIRSAVQPRPESNRNHHYRCNCLFKELILWLRSKGITARNPIHALRKEFGSQICAQAGIFAASSALRHSSINLTREYYIDKKQPTFFAVAKLIQPSPKSEEAVTEKQNEIA